jgi:hypothetical protein
MFGQDSDEVAINPQTKAGLIKRRSAVRVNGSLANLSVSSFPLAEAAVLYGTIILPFVILPARGTGHLFSLLAGDAESTSCLVKAKK